MSESSRVLARIVPSEPSPGQPARAQGTRVVLANGVELSRVSKITLVAQVDDLWRADIECLCTVDPVNVIASIKAVPPRYINLPAQITWWRRLLLKLAGIDALDVTSLSDEERAWQALPWRDRKAAATKDSGTESTGPQ